jgi:CRISPR system Cascade subunit CasB
LSKPTTHEREFIEYLEGLVTKVDRGALAALRRGLGKPPGTVHQMDRYVLRWLSRDTKSGKEDPYYLVAALFSYWYQGKDKVAATEGNLGNSLRLLVDERAKKSGNKREDVEKSLEKRLVALLNCHGDDLPDHLRQVVGLLKSDNIPMNWAQLLHDIKGWNWDSHDVQRSWAKGFWAGSQELSEEPTTDIAVAAASAAEA